MIRGIAILAFFALLVVVTVRIWDGRYQAVTDGQTILFLQQGGDVIRINKPKGDPEIVRSVDLPLGGEVSMLHLSFSHRSVQLVGGKEKWQAGRLIVDWHDRENRTVGHDTVLSLKGTDESIRSSEMVVKAPEEGWNPSLRFEHLGRSGSMEIIGLRVMAVDERREFVSWAALLVSGWVIWCFLWIGFVSEANWVRRVLAACMMFTMGWFLVIPGPWAHPRPLGSGFDKGEAPATVHIISINPTENKSANTLEPLGEMPVQGSWLVKVKVLLSLLRPLLHLLLFAGPAFALAVCCSCRCAWWTMVLVSLAVEASQAAFWHGANWVDGVDLIVDWVGIGIALLIYRKMRDWERPGFPFSLLQRMMLPAAKPSREAIQS